MSKWQIRAINHCQWGEPDENGRNVSKALAPGKEDWVPADVAETFVNVGAAERIDGGTSAAPEAPAIPSAGNDEAQVAEAARVALLERCSEAGIPTHGAESAEELQALLNQNVLALAERQKMLDERVAADAKTDTGTETGGDANPVLDKAIADLDLPGLPGAAAKALAGAGVETVRHLTERTRDAVDSIKGMGDATMDRLDAILEDAGLAWSPGAAE